VICVSGQRSEKIGHCQYISAPKTVILDHCHYICRQGPFLGVPQPLLLLAGAFLHHYYCNLLWISLSVADTCDKIKETKRPRSPNHLGSYVNSVTGRHRRPTFGLYRYTIIPTSAGQGWRYFYGRCLILDFLHLEGEHLVLIIGQFLNNHYLIKERIGQDGFGGDYQLFNKNTELLTAVREI